MKRSQKRVGYITVPRGTLVQPHELNVATILSWTGDDVEFLPTGLLHTADIKFRGLEWEIKTPIGGSRRTIENNLRLALKQSNNIVLDLTRIKLAENQCIGIIRDRAKRLGKKCRIIIITKAKEVIEL